MDTQRKVPGVLWISIVGLVAVSILQFIAAIREPAILVGVILNLVIAAGLYHGRRWAYVLLLVFAIAGVLVGFARHPTNGLVVLILDGIIVAPAIMSHGYFWEPGERRRLGKSHYCHRCGNNLDAVSTDTCPRCGEPIRHAPPPK